ncbi:MAG: hypothetical protein M1823_000946 [Watsoniomyces obsoletus]|nr:MAG: hypothetical protein M1823_000946 [Watsoniomyces obsoletus]
MSLSGLEAKEVSEALQATSSEPGGWFLLKYASRDEVTLLARGNGGVGDLRESVTAHTADAPLYGYLRFRRRSVLLRYVPKDASRLIQARVTVHFQSVADKFSPYDAIFTITEPAELKETALSAACSLHAASASISSTSSVPRRRLGEIVEDAEEGRSTKGEPDKPLPPLPHELARRQEREEATMNKDDVSGKDGTSTSEARPRSSSSTTLTLERSDSSATVPLILRHSLATGPSGARDATSMAGQASPLLPDFGAYDPLGPYSGFAYGQKTKVRLGPRPSLDAGRRYHTTGAISRPDDRRPVSSLPAGIRMPQRRGQSASSSSSSPNMNRNPHSRFPISISTARSQRSGSADGAMVTVLRPATSPSPTTPDNSMPPPPPLSFGQTRTPEKQKLMKALELRKRQMEQAARREEEEQVALQAAQQSSPVVAQAEEDDEISRSSEENTEANTTIDVGVDQDEGTSDEAATATPVGEVDSTGSGEQVQEADGPNLAPREHAQDVHLEVNPHTMQEGVENGAPETNQRASTDFTREESSAAHVGSGDNDDEPSVESASTQPSSLEDDKSLQQPIVLKTEEPTTEIPVVVHVAELDETTEIKVSPGLDQPQFTEDWQQQDSTTPTQQLPYTNFIPVDHDALDPDQTTPVALAPGPQEAEPHSDPQNLPSVPLPSVKIRGHSVETIPSVAHLGGGEVDACEANHESHEAPSDSTSSHHARGHSTVSSDSGLSMVDNHLDPRSTDIHDGARKKRRVVIEPIRTDISADNSDDNLLSDDSLMDELNSATVQEAKPVSLGRSPMASTFPMSTGGGDHRRQSNASVTHRAVSSPVLNSRSNEMLNGPTLGVPGGQHDFLMGSHEKQGPIAIIKKVNVSSGISQRIKALERVSSQNTRPSSPPLQGSPTTGVATVAPALSTLRKASVRSASNPTPHGRVNGGEGGGNMSPSPESIKSRPATRGEMYPVTRNESIKSKTEGESVGREKRVEPASGDGAESVRREEGQSSPVEQRQGVIQEMKGVHAQRREEKRSKDVMESSVNVNGEEKRGNVPTDHHLNGEIEQSVVGIPSTQQPVSASPPPILESTKRQSTSDILSMYYEDQKPSESMPPPAMSTDTPLTELVNGEGTTNGRRKSKRDSGTRGTSRRTSSTSNGPTRRSVVPAAAVAPAQENVPVTGNPAPPTETKRTSIDVGDVNVQFPDNMLWKRRFMRLDPEGYIILAASKADDKSKIAPRKYHMSEFHLPFVPDMDMQEMPNSVVLDFREGSSLQCACETAGSQAHVLNGELIPTPSILFDDPFCIDR